MRGKRICRYFLISICMLIFAFCLKLNNIAVYAEPKETTIYDFEEVIDGILTWEESENGVRSLDEFIQKSLPQYAGVSPTEWIVVSLIQYDERTKEEAETVFIDYKKALDEYVDTMENAKGTDYQRIAIAYAALSDNQDFVQEVIDTKAGSLGIMSYVYALDLMDTRAYTSEKITRDSIVQEILDLQLNDGGWALSGDSGDVDVTAMTIQSLALYRENNIVRDSIEEALSFLSKRQTENGDYKSYGISNAESTAQVLLALCSLDLNWQTDERFVKDGATVFDGLMKYRLEDGSFSHLEEGDSNGLASAQTMYAVIAAWRQEQGKTSLFRFTDEKITDITVQESSVMKKEDTTEQSDEVLVTQETSEKSVSSALLSKMNLSSLSGKQIKFFMCMFAGIIILILVFRLFVQKRFRIANVIPLLLCGVLVVGYFGMSNIQSTTEYAKAGLEVTNCENAINVTISIQCDAAIGQFDTAYIPSDGIILKEEEVLVEEGTTVFELLKEICQKEQIHVDYTENKMSGGTYVHGIQYLYEYDCGDLSGWMYQVNGEFPNVQSDSYSVEEGDVVRWVYTLNLGKDVGAE